MGESLGALFDMFTGFIKGMTDFWNWMITPVLTFGEFTISPLGIFGFATFIVVFTMVLIHLFNPVS